MERAKVWRENIVIPTYEVGQEEKNPIFLEKRVYQGSSGVVYPYPVIESIANERTDHEYKAVWLENEYIKVMILPELGGRVQMAYDKVKQRHFVYYNHVVKPALVGLAGPWISGGIEFNWPQHHRPSTFLPVDCDTEEAEDGSAVVWCSEMERTFHQKSTVCFRLRPGCAYLEINVTFYNRSELPQTFLWWANPAVEVNDDYQSVFPPDVNAVFDHGKRAVSSFPIATGTYYKMDYSAGVDISNYRNIKVPTSYMGVNSRYDFEGGYENDTHGGMLHVANHHVSTGKKQWTWGNGDFGRAWDRNLTDAATPEEAAAYHITRPGYRPYIELMAGVYTENQPDFTWIQPYEEKVFTQYFMPYRELGVVKQASRDFILNIEEAEGCGKVRLRMLATSRQSVTIEVRSDHEILYYSQEKTLSPEDVLDETINVEHCPFDALNVTLKRNGRTVLHWHAEPDDVRPIPDAAEAALPAEECKSVEQLYLTGLHLEQYRHATWSPLDYYEEALRRDPNDVRCLNQMGLWQLRRGRFAEAEPHLRRAVRILMKRNPNPYWSEPLYNLGLCLKYQGLVSKGKGLKSASANEKLNEAYDWFYKATWSAAQQGQGYLACAQISAMQGRWEDALHELNRALVAGYHNQKARALKAAVLRHIADEALGSPAPKDLKRQELINESLLQDRFNYGILFEAGQTDRLKVLMHGNPLNYHELALEYVQAGLYTEALAVLALALQANAVTPMTHYYRGWIQCLLGRHDEARTSFAQAAASDPRGCFPNRLEDIPALQCAQTVCPDDGLAPYLLGCLYYDKRQYDLSIELWERSSQLNPDFPTTWRNLALAAYNKQHRPERALQLMERAFHLDETDSRVLMELDQLYKVMHHSHAERLAFLQRYPSLVWQRDDLVLEVVTLLNQTGRYAEAMQRLDARQFHPWEGGEGKVPAQYQTCRVELAKEAIANGDFDKALTFLTECLEYPPHLGEGKLYGAQENDFYLLMGIAYERKGDKEKAHDCYLHATEGPTEPAAAMYYNDAKPDKIFYAGLAYRQLGDEAQARRLFHRLVDYGEKHLFDVVRMDYFAVSLPDLLIWDGDLQEKNAIHCRLMMALGHLGLSHRDKGMRYLEEVEKADPNHPVPPAVHTLLTIMNQKSDV